MTEVESEETFAFVDKRKLAAESAEEVDVRPEVTQPVSDVAETADEELSGGELSGLTSSHGLVAYVIGLIASDAWQKLGLIADPGSGKVVKDLKQAQFSIDCVAALVGVIDRSETELPSELRRDLQRALADLRLNYVEQSRRS
jgi:hypothetical protein